MAATLGWAYHRDITISAGIFKALQIIIPKLLLVFTQIV
jgi:hypothetical protein